jgi:hypothetical protein
LAAARQGCLHGWALGTRDPEQQVEIRWRGDFIGNGKVEVFDNANGGTAIDGKPTPAPASSRCSSSLSSATDKTDLRPFSGGLDFPAA